MVRRLGVLQQVQTTQRGLSRSDHLGFKYVRARAHVSVCSTGIQGHILHEKMLLYNNKTGRVVEEQKSSSSPHPNPLAPPPSPPPPPPPHARTYWKSNGRSLTDRTFDPNST